jgi:hypothetical protein
VTDIVYIALIVGFFAASVGLVRFCSALLHAEDER